ncbi:CCR4-Not complex component [Coprinopsis marcescibilis]|uniref:General negative regulator of transcription subunit 1 n=1 Tax=Coprinopsis marcescibilis TaxID=230819 RepID=A0A5C3KWN0_COPMA|nr:CCR4-Not complex component [Coprinopsis marcescibilis]
MPPSAQRGAATGDSFTRYGWSVCVWVLIVAFQYGYHISALNQIQAALTCKVKPISGSTLPTVPHLQSCIPMSDFTFSLVTSIFTLGGLAGSSVANLVMDGSGRKGALRICAAFIAAGAGLMGLSGSVVFLAIGRFLIGVGSGVGICVAPIFISEISPAKISGNIGVLTQLAIVFGIMTTQIIGLQFASESQWRIVLFISSVLGLAQFFASPLIAESPVWLAQKGRLEDGERISARLWGSSAYQSLDAEGGGRTDEDHPQDEPADVIVKVPQVLASAEFRKPLWIVCLAMLAQQISGINAVLYYSNDILSKSLPSLGPYLSLGITVVNVLMTFPPIILIERMGRKQLLTVSILGAISSLFLLGLGLNIGSVTLSSITIVTFVMSFAVGLGPIPFVMIPEVSPPRAVSALSSIALSLNWIANFLVGLLFLPLRNLLSGGDRFSEGRIFYLFGDIPSLAYSLKRSLEYSAPSAVDWKNCSLPLYTLTKPCWGRPFDSFYPIISPTISSKTATGLGSGVRRSVTPSRSSHMDNPPTTNIHTIVKAQIVFLLSTLTEENFGRNQQEILSLSEQHGLDTYLHFIRRLIVHSQSRLSAAPPASMDASTALTFRLLVQETQRLAHDPFLADRFRDGVGGGEGDMFRNFDLIRFLDRVGLRSLERFILASAIVAGRTRQELFSQAVNVIQLEFDNAVAALRRPAVFDAADLSFNQATKILTNLLADAPPDPPALTPSQKPILILAIQSKYGQEALAPILPTLFANLSLPSSATLIQTLISFGPDITSDPEVVHGLLERFDITDSNPPNDAQLIEIVSSLGRLAAEGTVLCDAAVLIHNLASYRAKLNWAAAIRTFDRPDRTTVDTATLKLLIAILLHAPRDQEPHAVAGFWEPWSNPLYQLRLLDALLSLPGDTFNLVSLPGKRIVTVDDMAVSSPTIKSLAANVQGYTWNSLELFQILVKLADSESVEIRTCVREMLDKAIKISAEIVQMGLLQVPESKWNEIRLEYSRKLLAMFLTGHPNHQLVFMRIWQIKPTYLTDAFRDFYDESNSNITRILDVAQDLKILDALLEVQPFSFALDVAALASRREYLNLDKWLADKVATHGSDFLNAVISFLHQKMESEKIARLSHPAMESHAMPLSPNTITIILRTLRNNTDALPETDGEAAIEVRNACLQIHPRLMSLLPGSDVEPGLTVVSYSNEIEGEVDAIYKQMYDEHISIDQVIQMLKQYKDSTNTHDHEIFSCMIHFLFDEYKFFQSYYPARELQMTGHLFGSLIQHKLIDYIPLGIAIRYIIDALNCPPETNLFKFGMQALSRFEFRLVEWRPLCEALLRIPALEAVRPELIQTIHRALASNVASTADPFSGNVGGQEHIPVFTAIQPDPMQEDIEEPPEETSDRILFIVNNLAPSNFDSKLKEMQEHFVDQYSQWFANYLVDQRVSTEPNNHPLYLRFLDSMDRQALHKYILQETFVKAAGLLNSEKSMVSGAERNTLKNIGSWLGTITLARDKPIRFKNLSFKELLIEGFESGRLVVAIPFVCKTLEPCAKSRVFKPPNPWLMAVLSLLVELYHFADLKLNLKFEIEVLCKGLNIELDAIEPTTILRNRPLEAMGGLPPPEFQPEMEPGATLNAEQQGVNQLAIEDILVALASNVQISSQFSPFNANPAFKRAVQLAIDRAVREIIIPVVERSVTIAGISTSELVIKDFASEINDMKLRKAGYLMAQKLAGSLALVTCKEPLKANLATHFRQYLNDNGFMEQHVPEAVVQILVQDNLDNACHAIEKAAMDRVVSDIEEGFAQSYEARKRHRESRSTAPFWDPAAARSNFSATLPDPLRIKPNGLQPHQLTVYEDFATGLRVGENGGEGLPYVGVDSPGIGAHGITHQEVMERFGILTRDLEAVVVQIPTQSLAALPANHDIRVLVSRVLMLAEEAADRERSPLMISQKIVQLLYKTTSQLGREVYIAILDQLCQVFEEVAKEAITWLLYAEDERKYNIPVTITLLRSGLLNPTLHDQQLAKVLFTDPRPNLVAYTVGLIREGLSGDIPALSQGNFQFAIDVIRQLSAAGKATEEMNRLLDDLRGGRRSADPTIRPPLKPEAEQLREKLHHWFQQWVFIFQKNPSPEKTFVPFITQLTKQGILKVEDVSSFFFRVCTEAGVSAYMKCIATGEFEYAFQALDAFSRLIVFIIKYHGDATGVNNEQAKVHYMTKILSIVVLVLANTHEEQGSEFQPKPFFRFFSSLVSDLHSVEGSLGPAYFQLLLALSDTYSSLQPTYFPGFAFSWMCLISHRLFMPKLLLSENREGWSAFHKLLLSLFKFLAPFLKEGDLRPAERDLYRGVLRLLLVILHDFPDFLSEYYFTICDVIPPRCVQLRNIILSAFPTTLVLPDPHLRNISFETLPEMGPIPPILSDFTSGLRSGDLRTQLDQYLLNRGSPAFLAQLKDQLKIPNPEGSGELYNLSLINAIVMYAGVSSVAQAKARSGSSLFVASDPGAVVLQHLANTLDVEGQHHLLSSIVLHLRYPNAHTHWFSSLLLYLFTEVKDERFREIMTKVLLERFIVHRPHPWGALVTFIELLRNPKYDFWNKDFVRIAPEVTLLLESVGRNL